MNNETEQPAMHYRKTGNGPAMVLVHGFPDNGEIWDAIADELKASFTLLIPDLPGSGKSGLQKETTLAEMAQGIRAILDAEGVAAAVVAGHSMGGYVALAFARLYPERVAGLSLVHSTPVADDDEKKKTRLKSIELIRNGGKETFIRQMTANLFATAFRDKHPEVVEEKMEMGLKLNTEGMINFCRAMMERDDNTEVLKNAQFPVQWILGEEDKIIEYKKILKECHQSYINLVTLYIGCGHISMIENPEMLVADLKKFGRYCYPHHSGS